MNIKEEHNYQSKSSYPTLVRVPSELQKIILNAKQNKVSIHTVRIIVSILARIKFSQMTKESQLDLFQDQFFQESNSYVKFNFRYKDFLPNDYTNIKPIKEAFKFLQDYENEYHYFTNNKGEKLEISGGIVMGNQFNLTAKQVTFHMNAYWYHQFLNLTANFNDHLVHLFFQTKSINTCILYSWLTTLPKDGTTVYIDTINERFGTKYTTYSELNRSLLKGIKLDLDKHSDWSFNYTRDSYNDSKVNVIPFPTNNELEDFTPKDLEYSKIKRKVHYLVKKHGLTPIQGKLIKSAFDNHGFDKINYVITKNKKTWTKNVQGEDFLNLFRTAYTRFLDVFEQSSS